MFEKLKESCRADWDSYVQHPFVRGMATGTLPKECFQHYLKQDYLFLIHFARAYALSIYKAHSVADMRYGMDAVRAILDTELELHIAYCREWGIGLEELERLEEATANMAYTRYVLERGMAGTAVDLHVALSPCAIGYAEVATWILDQDFTKLDGNPYRSWVEKYSSEEYRSVAGAAVQWLAEAGTKLGPGEFERHAKTFREATRLEIGFWQMGVDRSE